MKIIIAPTDKSPEASLDGIQHTSTIEHPSDDLNVTQAVRMFAYAMVSYGYHYKNVKECLEKDLGEDIFGVDK